jgi:hypothetical protein
LATVARPPTRIPHGWTLVSASMACRRSSVRARLAPSVRKARILRAFQREPLARLHDGHQAAPVLQRHEVPLRLLLSRCWMPSSVLRPASMIMRMGPACCLSSAALVRPITAVAYGPASKR